MASISVFYRVKNALACAGLLPVLLLLLSSCSTEQSKYGEYKQVDYDILLTMPEKRVGYYSSAKQVLENRCVVCHGCYDAPCQLKLSSLEGVQRGASPELVYNGARFFATEPTRLFIDAHTPEQWREKGFHPVISQSPAEAHSSNLDQSVMYQLLRLKQENPQPKVGLLPDTFTLGLDREQTCTTIDNIDSYKASTPDWGMPYAMPNLSDDEYRVLVQWLANGAEYEAPPALQPELLQQVQQWETFLNQMDHKSRLMSRYIYEHLFQGHLVFKSTQPQRIFFTLVRSSTPPGQEIKVISTVFPYDDPGIDTVYYRLQLHHSSIVAKDHVVYQLSPQRMARYTQLFLEPDYIIDKPTSYDPAITSNPFKVFNRIPPVSRYQFLLDDARFFIEGFIKGPVCRGQMALNVIEDRFWVTFITPDADKTITTLNSGFLNQMSDYLQLPTDRGDTLNLFSIYTDYWKRQKAYLKVRNLIINDFEPVSLATAMEYIWDGSGTDDEYASNPNAALTVFRHLDSASVRYGLVGDYPDTAWVIDYPLLERIHYLLVAGFNVYGNVGHQLNSRLYMDFLRMEGEDSFLALLPEDVRKATRDNWYKGMREGFAEFFDAPMDWLAHELVYGYQTDEPKLELYQTLEKHFSAVSPIDYLGRCPSVNCEDPEASIAQAWADRGMRQLTEIKGERLVIFPDIAFVRVRTRGEHTPDLTYTIIVDKAYKNVSSMFASTDQRDKEFDRLTIVRGLEGAYPHFFFDIEAHELDAFVRRIKQVTTRDEYEQLVALYGVRRTNTHFWATSDWFYQQSLLERPLEAGIFDLNRYQNR